MSFFENYVPQYPPFCDGERCVWWDVMEVIWSDPDSAGFRDSHYSQIKCRWLDAASSSIFSLFPHLNLHFNSSYFKYFFSVLTKIFPSCYNQRKFFPHTRAVVLYVEYYCSLCFNFQYIAIYCVCVCDRALTNTHWFTYKNTRTHMNFPFLYRHTKKKENMWI